MRKVAGKHPFCVPNFICLTLLLAELTHMELPNMHAYTYEDTHIHTHKNSRENGENVTLFRGMAFVARGLGGP